MLNISLINRDVYIRKGVSEIIKETLKDFAVIYRVGTDPLRYRNSDILIMDGSQVSGAFELKIEQLKNESVDLFIVLPNKNSTFSHEQLVCKKINTITYLFLDDSLLALKEKIIQGLKDINTNSNRKVTQRPQITCTVRRKLTVQEGVVIQYFKEGFTGGHIAKLLNKSEKTVSYQKRSAMKKMGVRNNIELIHHMLNTHYNS